jgi:hypothetical protein
MAKFTIKERLENPQLREGLLDNIIKKILKGKLKAKKGEFQAILKAKYGSDDKIPQYQKDFMNL